jgi:hypothetical protein
LSRFGQEQMRRLLAVGVKYSWEGDWQQAQGNERAAVAAPIGQGERVWLEVRSHDGNLRMRTELSATPVPIHLDRHSRYRIVKDCSGAAAPLATTVEVILSNGQAST